MAAEYFAFRRSRRRVGITCEMERTRPLRARRNRTKVKTDTRTFFRVSKHLLFGSSRGRNEPFPFSFRTPCALKENIHGKVVQYHAKAHLLRRALGCYSRLHQSCSGASGWRRRVRLHQCKLPQGESVACSFERTVLRI